MTLYLLNYNNFFNRIIKTETSISGYMPYVLGSLANVNFNPNDGVDTEQIINWSGEIPDYIVCTESTAGNTGIDSRWFVIEAQRTRAQQLRLKLKRDVIADHLAEFKQSTAFIQRGYLENSNPLIFNSEGNSFNQIKQSETLLTNSIESPWLILYLARYDGENNHYTYENQSMSSIIPSEDYALDSLSDYPYYNWFNQYITIVPRGNIEFGLMTVASDTGGLYRLSGYVEGGAYVQPPTGVSGHNFYPVTPSTAPSSNPTAFNNCYTTYSNAFNTTNGLRVNTYTGWGDDNTLSVVQGEQGKIIKVGSTYYQVNMLRRQVTLAAHPDQVVVEINNGTALANTMSTALSGIGNQTNRKLSYRVTSVNTSTGLTEMYEYQLSYTQVEYESSYKYTINPTQSITVDAPYEIFAAPYYDMQITISSGVVVNHTGRLAMNWFQDIVSKYSGAGATYDIQLVPYAPIDTTNWTDQVTFTLKNTSNNNVAAGVFLQKASFNLELPVTLDIESNNKIASETTLYRLVSPNGVGDYEFSPNKNGGLTSVHVDCTLKPHNPYIQVHPVWGWLYGNSVQEDFRGLICQGDFSLPVLTNEWSTYELQNKNYQAIFDRQIQSQDYQRSWQRASDIVGAMTGTAAGAIAGATAGSMIGGPVGGAAGAIVGSVSSATGGLLDVVANEKIYQEQRQASIETFNMNLGNVKARSNTLSRGSSYDIDNKYFPIIEYYTCTDTEMSALEKQLQYKGMNVGVIGQIQDYLNPNDTSYIQGDLIEIDITDDYHMAREIANVLKGGIRIDA